MHDDYIYSGKDPERMKTCKNFNETSKDFFSNWVETTSMIWSIFSLVMAVNLEPGRILVELSNFMNTVGHVMALILILLYWGMMPQDEIVINLMSVHQHAVVGGLLTLDVVLTGTPFRFVA